MKHALFVVFHYPPEASSSGVLRTLKFSRYLREFGWDVTVLTLERDAYEIVDPKLEAQIPDWVRVVRTRYLNTKQHLAIQGRHAAVLAVPDIWIGWYPWAVAAGRRIIVQRPVDLVFSTSPHATAHLIARKLARLASVPLVIDFRDPWYEEPPEPGTSAVVQWFAPRLERRAVTAAAQIVTSTTQLRDMLRQRYGEQGSRKFTAIFNGYDEADFTDFAEAQAASSARLTIVHAGNINSEYRDPIPLFRAISRAAKRGMLERSKILLRFIGGGAYGESDALHNAIRDCGLSGSVEMLARVPYADALAELAKADLLLLLQASQDTTSLVPAKLYEYLRSMRPVLALVLPGATSEVLTMTGGGWLANPCDEDDLEAVLIHIYGLWNASSLHTKRANMDLLRQFDRRNLTNELARVFAAAVEAPSAGVAPRRWAG